jgi:tetratricopeptide (TPR) repeat protein
MIDSQKSLKDNNLDQAVVFCDEAINLAATFPPHDTRYSKSEVQLAEIYCWQKTPDLAEKTFTKAMADCEKAAGSASTELTFPLSALANFYTFVSVHPDRVTPLLLRILNIVRNAPDHKDADIIMWSRNVGQSYEAQPEYAEAEPYFKQAVDLAEKTDPKDWYPHELLTAADFYRDWKKYPEALTLANHALSIREEELGSSTDVDKKLDVTVCLDNLGQTNLASANPAKAEAFYRQSLTIAESFMAPDQSDLSPRLAGLATSLRDQGKYAEAEPLYKRALAISEKNAGPNSKEVAGIREEYDQLLKTYAAPIAAKYATK